MKKYFYLLTVLMCLSYVSKANPGDTTWVQANNREFTHNPGVSTNWYGNYDTTVVFPAAGTTYRKIFMIFTLGKYQCPSGAQYCYQWDYTVQNYLMTPGGDTIEIGRFITPYVGAGDPNFPLSWAYSYVFDVTDYASLLHDTAGMRMFYSGYSGGFTGDIKFAFIEGTPERNVLGITHLWGGSFKYGAPSNPINSHFQALSETAPAGTHTADLSFTVTGHGGDGPTCCEFQSHNYQVQVNNAQVANSTIWRNDCGYNEIYPQTGTWVYNRGGWCPGDPVYPRFTTLTGVTAGSNYNVGITFDPYSADSGGSYTTDATVIYHGSMNNTLDASIEDIIAPTNNLNHFRENPLQGSPTILVRNAGSTPITSMQINYGVAGTAMSNYTWNGTLAPLQDSEIVLPEPYPLRQLAGTTGLNTFTATIASVNGQADNDATNNTLSSSFVAGPAWPVTFVVSMRTNSVDVNANYQSGTGGISETSWKIYDPYGNVVASRTNANTRTQYNDTVTLGPSWYKLVVTDSNGQDFLDGLHWWAEDGQSGYAAGSIYVRKTNNTAIPLNGNIASGTYNNDFGAGFTQYFTTAFPAGVTSLAALNGQLGITAYPNPAQNTVTLNIAGFQQVNGTVQIIDMLGRSVLQKQCNNSAETLNVSSLANGIYTIVYFDTSAPDAKLQTRLVIAK